MSPLFRPLPHRWVRTLIALMLVGGSLAVYYVNAKNPRDLNAFDRLVLAVSAPVQRMATDTYRWSGRIWHDYIALVDLKRENSQMKQEVQLLRMRMNELREVELENQRLRKLLDLTEQQRRPFRTARVVAYDPTSHYRTIRIDRGTSGGVNRGMVVATAQGLVGQILRAWANYADVLLITDPQSGVDALVQRTRARGTVEGTGTPVLRLKYLLRLDEVQDSDLVVTSGLDGVFPRGLLIGTVSGQRKRTAGVFQEVQIVPTVDLSRVEEVVVLALPPRPTGKILGPPIPFEEAP